MSDPRQQLRDHAAEGRALFKGLRWARTRSDAAESIRALRRWHRDLPPLQEACGIPVSIGGAYYPTLDEALPVVGPLLERPLVVDRHGQLPEAQRTMLVVTAAALSRLAPVLATLAPVPPKSPGGRPLKDPPERCVAIGRELRAQRYRGEKRNKEGAIKAVLEVEEMVLASVEFERAFERLRKRKTFP